MASSKTRSAVTCTERALTASNGIVSALPSGKMTPLPTKRTWGRLLAKASVLATDASSRSPRPLRMPFSRVSVNSAWESASG